MLAGPPASAPTKAVTPVGAAGVDAIFTAAAGWAITESRRSAVSPSRANAVRGGFRQRPGGWRRVGPRRRGFGANPVPALVLGAVQGAVGGAVQAVHRAMHGRLE